MSVNLEDVNFEQIVDHLVAMRDLEIIKYGYDENTHFRRVEDISKWIEQLGYNSDESEELIDLLLEEEYLDVWRALNGNEDHSNIRICAPSNINPTSVKSVLHICLDHIQWKEDLINDILE